MEKDAGFQESMIAMQNYFAAGVRLVWYIHPETRTSHTFTSPTEVRSLAPDGTLGGSDVLPGLELPLSALLQKPPRANAKRP